MSRRTHESALSSACSGFRRLEPTRRHILKVGGLGLLGLNLPRLLRAEETQGSLPRRAKSVIFLYQFGGPSHLDMFDMKPDAPDGIRGPLKPMPTVVPGLQICDRLPRLAKVMDRVTLIRTMHHEMKNHNSASYYALTGHAPPLDDIRLRDTLDLFPAYGSVVDFVAPAPQELPTFVAYPHVIRDGAVTPGQHASFLGKAHDPFLITEDPNSPGFRLPQLSLPAGLPLERIERRREIQTLIDRQSRLLEVSAEARGLDAYYVKALSMLASTRVARAFDLSAESPALRDAYGRHTYGQGCLLARRLVEAGVRFVTVYFASNIGGQSTTSGGWDTHGFNNTRMYPIIEKYHLPITDQTLPTFLADLDSRGLLDETLVLWMGEFGRTPKLNDNSSRDHWPQCYTALLAGGGVKRGHVHGASDRSGAFPARDPVRPEDLAATMYYLLGIDPGTEVRDAADRPLLIAEGKPVLDVIA
ncbi:MAG TPA: DUF1501 domain-containing protein [Planctomycetota bacterium]|nr:DUF1501 domain-containing protein [Planctomycetota bacterium]